MMHTKAQYLFPTPQESDVGELYSLTKQDVEYYHLLSADSFYLNVDLNLRVACIFMFEKS